MDVNSLRFTPDWAGQTHVCSCCLCSCWGTGWGVRLSKLPTCEVSKTKTLGYVKSHQYGKKEEERNPPPNIFLQYTGTQIKTVDVPPTSSARFWVMRAPWLVSNKPPDLLFWIILLADCQQQVARASAMDSQQPLYYTQSHHWWATEVEGDWWKTNRQMCSVGCTLTKSGRLRENKKYKLHFDTVNGPINLGATEPAYKTNDNNVSYKLLSEQWKDNIRGDKKKRRKAA